MDVGFSTAIKKLGTIGCTVKIMRAGTRLPHEIIIHDRAELGLDPIEEVSMLEIPEDKLENPISDVENDIDAEDVASNVVDQIAKIEASAENEDADVSTNDVSQEEE
jgi:small subunit ribosomal protein S3